jgi:CheY-like chemotaxis protein
MRIAVCDDEQNCRENIHTILLSCEWMIRDLSVALFASGKDLLGCYRNRQRFDLIFWMWKCLSLTDSKPGRKSAH